MMDPKCILNQITGKLYSIYDIEDNYSKDIDKEYKKLIANDLKIYLKVDTSEEDNKEIIDIVSKHNDKITDHESIDIGLMKLAELYQEIAKII